MIDVKAFRKKYNITQSEICSIINVKQPYLSAIESGKRPLSKDKFEILYNHFGDKVLEFRVIEPLLPFGTGMQKQQPGANLLERLSTIDKNLTAAQEWHERAEQLVLENEGLKTVINSLQQTIKAHEATIQALQQNIDLLKEGKAQAKGRAKAVVRGGEG